MAKTIDERIVSLKFDNAQFKQAASETISVLEGLKSKLNVKGITGGLKEASNDIQGISKATQQVNMGNLTNSVAETGRQFNILGTVATGALLKIGSSITETAAKMADAMFLRGARDGFAEYELQMNSVQTIMANTARHGTTLQEVNDTLDNLNQYADKTIYNFAEMTRNIGTFTAAGVGLDTSAKAIKGIANLAAMSGSNSQQASTAMYQLSQAIAAGSVKLQDWNSVVNAGMGGQAFQEALWDSAKAMGQLTEKSGAGYDSFQQWIDAGNSFRESLSEGWISSDVLTSTLENFTGELSKADLMAKGFTEDRAQYIFDMSKRAEAAATEVKTLTQLFDTMGEAIGSGWAQTWQILIGDFEEAKQLFTGINSVIEPFINNMADARNSVLAQWKAGEGRDAVIEGITSQFKFLGQVIEPVIASFRKFFKLIDAPFLNEVTHQWKLWSNSLKLSEENASKIGRVFDGVFSVLRVGFEILKGGMTLVGRLLGVVTNSAGGILDVAAAFGDLLSSVAGFILNSKVIPAVFDAIFMAIRPVIQVIGLVIKAFGKLLSLASGPVLWALPKVGALIAATFETIGNVVNRVRTTIVNGFINPLTKAFGSLQSQLATVLGFFQKFYQSNLSGPINSFVSAIQKQGRNVTSTLKSWGDEIQNFSASSWEKLTDQVSRLGLTLKGSSVDVRNFFSRFNPKTLNESLGVTKRLESAFRNLKSTMSGIQMPDFSGLKSRMPDMSGFGSNIKSMGSSIGDSMGNMFSSVKMVSVSGMFDGIKKSFSDLVSYIQGVNLGNLLKSIGSGFADLGSSALSALKSLGSSLRDALGSIDWGNVGKTAAELLIKGITGAVVAVGSIAKWLTDTLMSAVQSIDWGAIWGNIKDFGQVFADVGNEMSQAFQGKEFEAPQIVAIFGESNADKITKNLQSVGDAFRSTGGKIRAFSDEVKKGDALQGIREMVGDAWVDNNDAISKVMAGLTNTFKKSLDSLNTLGTFIKNPFTDMATKFKTSAKTEMDGIGTALQQNFQAMAEKAADIDVSRVMNAFGVSLFGAAALQFSSLGKTIVSPLKSVSTAIDNLAKSGVGVLDAVRDSIKGFQKIAMIEAQSNAILKVAIAIAAMAASVYFLAQLDPDALWRGVAALGGMMAALGALMVVVTLLAKSLAKTDGATKSLLSIALAMIGLAIAIAVMTHAVTKLGALDFETLKKGLGAVAIMMGLLVLAVKLLPEKDLLKASVAIFTLAASMGMLARAVEKMGNLEPDQIKKGLITMAGAIGIMVAATRLIKPSTIMGVSASLTLLAVGIGLMAMSLRLFEGLDPAVIRTAMYTLAAVMGVMAVATRLMDPSRILAISLSVGILAVSMMLMLRAIQAFAEVDEGVLAKGIFSVAAAIGAIGLAMNAFPKSVMDKVGFQMILLAGAMLIMASAIEKMGSMDAWTLAKGILAIGASIAAIGIALKTLSSGGGMGKAAITLALLAGGLYLLAGAIQRFESIDPGTMTKALLALGAAMASLAVMSLLMGTSLPTLLAVTAAIAVIGGTMYLMASAFEKMAEVPTGAVTTLLIAFAAALLIVVGAAFLGMAAVPGLLAIAAAFAAIGAAAFLLGAGAALIGAGILMIANAVRIFAQLGPEALAAAETLGQAISIVIAGLIVGLMSAIPIIVEALFALLTAFLSAFDDFLTVSGPTIVSIFGQLIELAAQALEENIPVILSALETLITSIIDFVVSMAPVVGEGFLSFIEAIIGTLTEGIPRVVTAMVDLYQALWDTIATEGPRLIEITVNGIKDLAVNIIAEITGQEPEMISSFASAARNAVGGFISGLWEKLGEALGAVRDFGRKISDKFQEVLKIKSPSRVFMSHGRYVVEGFAVGVNKNAPLAFGAVGAMANGVISLAESIFGSDRVRKALGLFGISVAEGAKSGLTVPESLLEESLNGMIAMVQGKTPEFSEASKNFFDGLANSMSSSKFNKELAKLTKHAEAQRATLIKEQKLNRMKEEDAFKERREKVYEDVEDAKRALAEAEEDRANAAADAKQQEADAKNEAAKATKDKNKAEQEKKQTASDATKARRDAEKREKDIVDARKKLQKAERELELYEYEMAGEEAGVAFIDGIAAGLIKEEEKIPTLAESITEVLWKELEKGKNKVEEYLGAFDGMKTIQGTFSSISTNLRNFRRALTRASNASNDKSFFRNISMAGDALLSLGKDITQLMSALQKLQPVAALALGEFEKNLPAIIKFVEPFAPQLAATLGGGLTAAIPAILGPAGAIVGGLAAIFAVLYDFGSEQKIKRFIDSIVNSITKFIKDLPSRLAGFVEVLSQGLIWFAEHGPDWIVQTLLQVIDAVIIFLTESPDAVERIVTSALDALVALLTVFPFKLLDAALVLFFKLFEAIVKNLPLITVNLLAAFFKIGVTLVGKILEGMGNLIFGLIDFFLKLPGKISEAVKSSVNGIGYAFTNAIPKAFKNAIDEAYNIGYNIVKGLERGVIKTWETAKNVIAKPFSGLIDGVKKIFKIKSPSREFMEIGRYLMEGFADGVDDRASYVDSMMYAFQSMIADSMRTIMQMLAQMMQEEMVFRPRVDMTDAVRDIQSFGVTAGGYLSSSIATSVAASMNQATGYAAAGSTNIVFNQTNTSPKPLSAIEIYRNTDRMLEAVR